MPEPSAQYISVDLQQRFRTQALWVWAATLAVVVIWVVVIVAAPLAHPAADPLYRFFSYVCHQIPERSLHIAGHPMAVCSRCFGVYFGLVLGIAVYPVWRAIEEIEPVPRFWLFLSLIPVTIDWSLTIFGIWENTHVSRFVTGLILGVACATFIVPALVEITRNVTGRRHAERQ